MLVVTGWPLRFPELPASKLMSAFVGGPVVIGIFHRIFGVMLVLVSLYHIGYLVLKFARGHRSTAMLPTWRDAQEAFGDIKYWLGFSRERMQFGRYNWIEKVEYYAVVWGTAVMILSGLIIWVPVVAARFIPGWAIPAAVIVHGYEALLAGLAIFLWHFYWVHLHPSIFPMSSVWLTGKLTEGEMEHHHPRELAELRSAQPAPERGQA
jgi:cytochrome b subunit of formate dehydrogenase